jgi:hypothetical protein
MFKMQNKNNAFRVGAVYRVMQVLRDDGFCKAKHVTYTSGLRRGQVDSILLMLCTLGVVKSKRDNHNSNVFGVVNLVPEPVKPELPNWMKGDAK